MAPLPESGTPGTTISISTTTRNSYVTRGRTHQADAPRNFYPGPLLVQVTNARNCSEYPGTRVPVPG
eukprot:1021025-Rhodomonas_salina.1